MRNELRARPHTHYSIDDPLIWGVLPLSVAFQPWNLRWGLGAHDICFANKILSTFFTLGQVLPVHRNLYSQHAGLFQPSMTQAIRLLSAYPFKTSADHFPNSTNGVDATSTASTASQSQAQVPSQTKAATVRSLLADLRDPFSDGSLTYSTTGEDVFTAPSAFLSNRHAWVHVFPEGSVHQHPERQMRYFRWGVSRLVLEAEPMPDLVPMFIDGTSDVMHESRGAPRFVPRAGKDIRVVFGEPVDMEATFGDLRARWKALVRRAADAREAEIRAADEALARVRRDAEAAVSEKTAAADRLAGRHGIVSTSGKQAAAAGTAAPRGKGRPDVLRIGELTEELKYDKEAEAIRVELARRIREEVLKLRRSLGYPDEDPDKQLGLAKTWAKAPKDTKNSPIDGSIDKPAT